MSPAASVVVRDDEALTVWQRPLPRPWQCSPSPEMTPFVHPAEMELARILTAHGVRWVYEPTTFVLRRDPSGQPALSFNPDFYLPDHGRYIELTTMRQAHVTRKNRKLRLLRELFPSVDVHLLYRRDMERITEGTGPMAGADLLSSGPVVSTRDEIERRSLEMAIDAIDRGAPDVVLTLGAGAARLAGHLVAALAERGVAPATGCLSIGDASAAAGGARLRVRCAPRVELRGRRVLVVTDIVSTGLAADLATRWLVARGAGRVDIVTLLDRPTARIVVPPVRAAAFTIGDVLLAGHGVAIGGRFGELPDLVAITRPPVASG